MFVRGENDGNDVNYKDRNVSTLNHQETVLTDVTRYVRKSDDRHQPPLSLPKASP
jgi:hypothetical protein